jgi:hypothetical protein
MESKLPETLGEAVFPRNKTSERRKCNRGGSREKQPWPTRPDARAMWGLLVLTLLLWCRRSSSRWMRFDLKSSIKGSRCGSRKGAPPKHRNVKQKPGRSKTGGENSGRALPVWSPSPLRTLPSSPWWRGGSPPLDYRFVTVANCISLLFFIVLAPYELHNMIMAIFVSLSWWIFLWVIYEIAIVL